MKEKEVDVEIEEVPKKFNSKMGFILSCVGSAVGMANIWWNIKDKKE